LGCFAYRTALGKSFGLDLGAASAMPPYKEGGSKYESNIVPEHLGTDLHRNFS